MISGNCSTRPYGALNGENIKATMKAYAMRDGSDYEYMHGKAGNANFEIYPSKDSGFSISTDKGYVSVNADGQIHWCKTVDNNGDEVAFRPTLDVQA